MIFKFDPTMKSQNTLNNTVKIKFIPHVLSALWAISILLLGNVSNAQTLQLQYTFADGPGTTTTSSGALPVVLNLISNNVPFDLHGAANSGVQNEGYSLNLSHNPISGNSGAQAFAVTSSNMTLATLGTVGDFTASVWFKFTALTTNLVNNSTRFFTLAPNGVTDNGNANGIGLNISVGGGGNKTFPQNAINVLVGSSAATIPPVYYNFPTNEWLFCSFTYTSASGVIAVYFGSEASPAKLYVTRNIAAGTTFNLVGTGGATSLSIGNRINGGRDFPGWIGDFRFYTGAGDSNFVENIRQSATAIIVTNLAPDGSALLSGTNTLSFTASSTNGISTNNVKVLVNGSDVSSNLSFSGTSTSLNVLYPNLPVNPTVTQQANLNGVAVQILVMDNAGITTSNAYVYDAFSPTNFTWECEDYDFGGGQFIDNPVLTFTNFGPNTYYNEQTNYIDGVDASDNGNVAGPNRVYRDPSGNVETEYSAGAGNNGGNSIGELTRQVVWNAYAQTTIAGEVNVGYFDGGTGTGLPNWMNYTRTYPTGNFNVYLRAADGAGSLSPSFDSVTNGWGTTGEALSHVGNFNMVNSGGWDSFAWIPLRDTSGNLVQVKLGGTNTFRLTAGPSGGGNVNFFMLTPANTNLPSILNIYPNGTNMFQPSATLSFIANSPAGINISTNSITVHLISTTLLGKQSTNNLTATNGLSFSGSAANWTVTASLNPNLLYTASITVVDANGSTASSSVSFDTLAPVYTWEAPDYDYSGGQFIPEPIPVDGYSNLSGSSTIDYFYANTPPANTYRDSGAVGVENNGDSPLRLQYITNTPAPQPYDLGYYNGGNWLNYTRNFPAGEYNVFVRAADGLSGGGLGSVVAAVVTNGWGTSAQGTTNLGTFSIPNTGGWQTYTWTPLRDVNGNLVKFTGGTTNTLKMTSSGAQNVFFYALFAANTNLPTLLNLYPNGTTFSQVTNTFSFNIASAAGVSSNSVIVTVNGIVVSNLVFTGNQNSWMVTYPHLQPNTPYVITVSITDANGNSSTASVTFDTMSPNNYTWEAEDFDYTNGLFFDNPQTNAYAGLSATPSVDTVQVNFAGTYLYRPNGMDTEINGDIKRPHYLDPSNPQSDYSIGFFSDGAWANYTRDYPAGTYNVYGRFAAGGGNTDATLSQVVTNQGTVNEVSNLLGTFSIPNTGGWENYQYVPLRDTNGNLVAVTLNGSTNTLQLGRPVDNPGSPDVNVNFLMLTPIFTANASRSGTNVLLSFQTMAGFNYQVQYKTNLRDPGWISLGSPVSGNNALQSVTDPATSTTRFYRVQIQ